jgi:hypothetical protein
LLIISTKRRSIAVGCLPRDDLRAHLVEADLHLVDLLLVDLHLRDRVAVVGLEQAMARRS